MSWENLVDTWLNVGVFLFVAVLFWLYFKKEPTDDAMDEKENLQRQGPNVPR